MNGTLHLRRLIDMQPLILTDMRLVFRIHMRLARVGLGAMGGGGRVL
jgi:hypothetical protein